MKERSLAKVEFRKLMMKRLHYTGSTLRARTVADKGMLARAVEAKVLPLLRDGRFKTVVDSTFPLERAADAHRRMEGGQHIGKIVLTVSWSTPCAPPLRDGAARPLSPN